MTTTWQSLAEALERWRAAGRQPVLWLRDDDAIEPTGPLDRLLDVTARFEVPLVLAVIPSGAGAALGERVAQTRNVTAVVHGWAHQNHAPAGQKKQELGPHRPAEAVLGELGRGLERITRLFPGRSVPLLVPPWNRIDPALVPELPGIGYRGLSTFGRPKPAPLRVVNTTVDIMDWHGTRGCRDYALIIAEIVEQLDAALADPKQPPVGLLTHHLVHDEAAWALLERLFEITTPVCRWVGIDALLGD